MAYLGNPLVTATFLTDSFSGNGSTTGFTLTVSPANTASILVIISGVTQDPSTYSINGTTLNFSAAPPSGTNNISVRYLGIPANSISTAAYRTITEFTATAGQTTFTPASYTVGYIDVYRNGVLLGSSDYTATNGTTVVLALGCVAGDSVKIIGFYVSSVLNAIPNTSGSISSSNLPAGLTINTPTISSPTINTATINTATITTPTISSPTITTSATLPAATTIGGMNYTPYTLKNRIINGDMVVNQRIPGTVTLDTNSRFIVDRFFAEDDSDATVTGVQSTTAPTGFVNSMLFTVTTADSSIAAGQNCTLRHWIEGLNTADLAWGTASAKTVTLSFWVRSSVTGTHSGSLLNSATNRCYVFTYTISAADTWEQKTVTIPGDTSGTWLTTNGRGIGIYWNLGAGSTFLGTAGSWGSSLLLGATGSIQLISTLNATFYITGVQLEQGSTATAFEWLPFATELQLCQRYYEKSFNYPTVPANGPNTTSVSTPYGLFVAYSTNGSPGGGNVFFKVSKRTDPSMTAYGNSQGYWYANGWGVNSFAVVAGENSFYATQQNVGGYAQTYGHWAASAEL